MNSPRNCYLQQCLETVNNETIPHHAFIFGRRLWIFSCTRLRQKRPNFIEKFSQAVSTAKVERYLVTTTGYSIQLLNFLISTRTLMHFVERTRKQERRVWLETDAKCSSPKTPLASHADVFRGSSRVPATP